MNKHYKQQYTVHFQDSIGLRRNRGLIIEWISKDL